MLSGLLVLDTALMVVATAVRTASVVKAMVAAVRPAEAVVVRTVFVVRAVVTTAARTVEVFLTKGVCLVAHGVSRSRGSRCSEGHDEVLGVIWIGLDLRAIQKAIVGCKRVTQETVTSWDLTKMSFDLTVTRWDLTVLDF
jgi:hypothetical protein